jgi:hypothetical protein
MAATLEEFLAVKNRHAQRLLTPSIRPGVQPLNRHIHVDAAAASAGMNVHAIGVGTKMVAGKPTQDLCIRIYVIQKLPKSIIPFQSYLPEMLDGLPTDIIESAPTFLLARRRGSAKVSVGPKAKRHSPIPKRAHMAGLKVSIQESAPWEDSSPGNLTSFQRPLFGGISAANSNVLAGTLGCFCRSTRETDDPGARFILSNRHVLGRIDGEPQENIILQPSKGDLGTSDEWVARYARAAKLNLSPDVGNTVDAAIAQIRQDLLPVTLEVGGIGRLGEPIPAALKDIVRKCGKKTGLTEGVVKDISFNTHLPVEYDPQNRDLYLINQIRIERIDKAFAGPGDSGSIVVGGTSNGVIGLLCAGNPSEGWGVVNPIKDVMEALQIALL